MKRVFDQCFFFFCQLVYIEKNSRHSVQFSIINYLYYNNLNPEDNFNSIFSIIKENHRGLSQEINNGDYATIQKEIKRQIEYVYQRKSKQKDYPHYIDYLSKGILYKKNLKDIFYYCNFNLPRMNFLSHLISYFQIKNQTIASIHKSKLIYWSSNRTYNNYLKEFEKKGILTRSNNYSVNYISKKILFNEKLLHKNNNTIKKHGFKDIKSNIKKFLKIEDYIQLLKKNNIKKQTIQYQINQIYKQENK